MSDFRKSIFAIALPVSFQSLIQASLSMIDQFMIGQLGTNAIASVGLGAKGLFILLFVLSGIGGGASVFISQYQGKGEENKIAQVMCVTLLSGGIITAVFFFVSIVTPGAFISLFTGDPAVRTGGASYLRYISAGYLPLLAVITWSAVLRSTGHTKLPMYAGLVSVAVNTFLNYLLIFGHGPFPPMGLEGAALATTASRFIEAAFLLTVVFSRRLPGSFPPREWLRISPDFIRPFAVTTVPLVLTELLWVLGDSAFSAIYGRIGTIELAAMTLTGPVQMITIGLLTGISTAAAVILGNELGSDNSERAGQYAGKFLIIGIAGTAFLGLIVVLLSPVYVSAFRISPESADMALKILRLFALVLWIKVSNMIMGNGILRSGGDTRFVMMMDTIGMWLIGVPMGILAAFVWKLPFPLVYMAVTVEEVIRMIFMLNRTRSGKWLNNLVKEL
ncbi:MATE family efflux transporter [Spirochaeta isovalerica]|uniref:Putative MATE family efflux protein n=1 Tax=Spirochaeta isovalerica TaxID=150 RepID=A0A841RDY9_9SPIO|nr:MATE family efflux transporter [Spirochaeta isovalerica]MBB6480582.1 putative MATE family efflux protein [Spirochaeta isovalerica]